MRIDIRLPLLLLAILFVLPLAHGQKRGKVDPKDVTIDSLVQVNEGLQALLDSIATETVRLGQEVSRYQEVYKIVRDKLVKREFKPSELWVLLDVYMSDEAEKLQQAQRAANENKTRMVASRALRDRLATPRFLSQSSISSRRTWEMGTAKSAANRLRLLWSWSR